MCCKTGELTQEELKLYKDIEDNVRRQQELFKSYITKQPIEKYQKDCAELGLKLNVEEGTISYASDGKKPLSLDYELCYVRHGKTEGNTEPRVFQGQVDYPENQLVELGLKQADLAAEKMHKDHADWIPDLIVCSPLHRAIDTSNPYRSQHPDIPFVILDESAEMAFGFWDNKKVIDLPCDDIAHLFYLTQNVLVKAPGPHIVQKNWFNSEKKEGSKIMAENFVEVLCRMKSVLLKINEHPVVKNIASKNKRPKVLMYGHSMVGAAILILLGYGKNVSGSGYLGFDGKYIMPNAIPTILNQI